MMPSRSWKCFLRCCRQDLSFSLGSFYCSTNTRSQQLAGNALAMLRATKLSPRAYGALLRVPPRRHFADTKPGILSSDPAFPTSSQSPSAAKAAGVPLGPVTPATPTTSTIPPQNASPTSAPPIKIQTAPPTSAKTVSPPPPPPPNPASIPPPPPKKSRFLRNIIYAILFSGVAYGGAVLYALNSDNFHDFFTEYVPFGEESVLYFEERSFRSRFPNARHHTYEAKPAAADSKTPRVTIPSRAGLSWKVQEEKEKEKGSDLTQKGRHMSAVDANKPATPEVKTVQPDPKTSAVKPAPATPVTVTVTKEPEKSKEDKSVPSPAIPSPKSDPRPPAIAPVTQLSPLQIANADEPLVQELVKIVNDMITVINADGADASNKYAAPITKAKESLAEIGKKIVGLRDIERKAAEEQVAQAHKEFDEGAKDLLRRIETAQREDDAKYREEFEAEREKIRHSYDERLKAEIERSQQLADQRRQNELTEQAIELKRSFVSQIQDLVESERGGRLSKLTDLSTNVDTLQELTSNWNGVIDSNLHTQKLQVAVDAVRTALTRATAADARPQPFVREMAALKLVADGDAVVDAAIASINPTAYQRGIPSPAQLIDRYRRVASEVRKASLLPEDAGVASHAASFILSKVLFKKQGQPQGSDVESILTRTETLLEEGDLDNAAREMNTLQGWSATLAKDWLQDCRKVLEVRQALEVMEAEAKLQCLRIE